VENQRLQKLDTKTTFSDSETFRAEKIILKFQMIIFLKMDYFPEESAITFVFNVYRLCYFFARLNMSLPKSLQKPSKGLLFLSLNLEQLNQI
jgi:hypothetical protein